MELGRRVSTVRQLELLVEFAETNRELALGRLRSKEARVLSARLWRECAESLNSEGPARLPKEWTKIWNDLKSRVRAKLTANTLSQRGTGGGPHTTLHLSSLEDKVAEIIGRDIGPIPNVAQNQFIQAPEDEVLIFEGNEGHEANEATDEHIYTPGPSSINLPLPPPPPETPVPLSPSLPPSPMATTPRRSEQGRGRGRGRTRPRSQRGNTHGPTSRDALEESRNMMLRIEELRARTDNMLAEAAVKQAEAALISAEASRLQAHAMATFCHSLSALVPAVQQYLQGHASPEAQLDNNEEGN